MFLSQTRREEELKTDEPNHNAKPNRPVMLRRMKRMRMRHQGKEDGGKSPNPGTAVRKRRETTAV